MQDKNYNSHVLLICNVISLYFLDIIFILIKSRILGYLIKLVQLSIDINISINGLLGNMISPNDTVIVEIYW